MLDPKSSNLYLPFLEKPFRHHLDFMFRPEQHATHYQTDLTSYRHLINIARSILRYQHEIHHSAGEVQSLRLVEDLKGSVSSPIWSVKQSALSANRVPCFYLSIVEKSAWTATDRIFVTSFVVKSSTLYSLKSVCKVVSFHDSQNGSYSF